MVVYAGILMSATIAQVPLKTEIARHWEMIFGEF